MTGTKLHTLFASLCLVLSLSTHAQQDVWLQSYSLPVSECGMSNSEIVQVSILNNSAIPMVFNTITAYYNVDSGPVTSQVIGATLSGNASINFAFNVNANLSACGSHTIKVWVSRPNDPNQNNDTLQWVVQNDCNIIPGDILSTSSVCASNNSGALNLSGWSNGTITDWQSSINGGGSWSGLGNNTTTYNYTNISQNTIYRVLIDGGQCPDAYSDTAQITVVAAPLPGTMNGATSLCITNASGSVNLSGTSSPVLSWESSTNGGGSWSTISNTTYNLNYSNLTSSTLYRALLNGNECPDIYSNTALITIDPLSGPGVLTGSNNFCASNATGSITLSGPIGPVLYWESSINNGGIWTNIANTTTTLNYNNLSQTTWYRAYTQGSSCPSIYSDTAIITVQAIPIVPSILGTDSLCISNVTGTLSIPAGFTVMDWEISASNAGPWSSLSSNALTNPFTGLTSTQYYRVLLDGNDCPDYYSNIGVVYVEQLTEAGLMSSNDTVCISNPSGSITVGGNVGNVEYWQFSTNNGATWQTISNTATTYNYNGLTDPTLFRVFTDGGFCPSYFSDTVEIMIADTIKIGSIAGDGLFCEEALSGSIDITGSVGSISNWEYSTNNGASWTNIANGATSYPYSNVTNTTWYRAFFEGNVCPDKYSDTAIITIDPISNAGLPLSNISVCEGADTSLILTNYSGTSIQWESSTDGISWSQMAGETNVNLILPDQIASSYYRAIVTSGICPPDTTNQAIITINPIPLITISDDITITEGDTTSLLGVGGATGVWSPNISINDITINNPDVYPIETIYYVYSVIGANGCPNTDSVLVTVLPPTYLDIKNVVTRNGDGYNDVWYIEGIENYPNTEVHLFNIYGTEVYSNNSYANEWDGMLNGKKLPNGTYYYVVHLAETDEEIKGTVLLLGDE